MAAPTGATPSGHGAPEAATAVVIDLNGHATTVAVRADEAAVTVIRERCGLTGTKYVCGTGVCGACTVLVDGVPIATCLLSVRGPADP